MGQREHEVRWYDRLKLRHLLVFGFVLRLAWALLVPAHPVSDSFAYDQLAQQIAAGHGYAWPNGRVTAYWPVGTSALYALVYAIFGHSLGAASVLNVIIGTLLIAATYGLARSKFDRRIALVASAIVAMWPSALMFTSIVSSEVPGTLCLTAAVALALSDMSPKWLRTILSTMLFVAAAFFRANLLPLVLIVPVLQALTERSWRQCTIHATLAALTAGILIAPWMVRNYYAFGAPVTISTNLGINMWIGNNPLADGGYKDPPPIGSEPLPQNEVAQSKLYQSSATAFIVDNPARYVALSLNRLRLTLDRETFGVAWNEASLPEQLRTPLKLLATGYWWAVLLSGLLGLALCLRRSVVNLLDPIVVVPAIAIAPSVLVMAVERYHYGIVPFLAIFAGYLVNRFRRSNDARTAQARRAVHAASASHG